MSVTGINDQMRKYGEDMEVVYKNRPKHGKEYGIKRPDTRNIIAVFAGIFVIVVVISQLM
ncbi:MAG: hypothetical protein NTX42_06040 [Methanothrix sp.]|nr:hypothetical protein [Methanothrix sp.]